MRNKLVNLLRAVIKRRPSRMTANYSLSYKVLRRGIVGIAVITVILCIFIYVYERYTERINIAEKSDAIMYRVSKTFALPFWNLDQPMIDALITLEMRDEDLLGFAIYDKIGSLWQGIYKSDGSLLNYTNDSETTAVFKKSTRSTRATLSLNDQMIGFIDIYFTDDAITRRMWEGLARTIALLLTVSGILFLFLHKSMQKKVIEPVIGLSRVVAEFSRKNFSVRAPIHSGDELGELALHFNEMADIIEQYSRSLESMVEERTQQLIVAEKMAALGELVAGISHEINTPIGTAITAASFIERGVHSMNALVQSNGVKRSELIDFMRTTEDAMKLTMSNLERASELVQSFKKIAVDRTSDDHRVFNIKTYLNDVVTNLRPRLKRTNHVVRIDCDDNLEVNSFPGDIWQIITNFIVNSLVHAFPDDNYGGVMTIDVRYSGNILVLRYSDNGIGIPEEHIHKIYDPFFTTRRGSGGSGLGLNVVYNLVTQKLRGSIECTSTKGKGTTFVIQFPVGVKPVFPV
jgi:two-component system NtrC family sensor kinase